MTVAAAPLISLAEARTIAKEAYIYGFPLVDNYRIMHSYFINRDHPEFKAPWNQIRNNARVYTPEDRAVQTPNSDTPYSQLGADLRSEPLVLSFPDVPNGRYCAAQFIDLYTFNFAYVGTRTTGNSPGKHLLVGPTWRGEPPPGIDSVIQCETDFAFVLYRTQLRGADDLDEVRRIQDGYRVQPLSAFLGRPPPPPAPEVAFLPPPSTREERTSLHFFKLLNFVLQFCPVHPTEHEMFTRFARLGVGAGRSFEPRALGRGVRNAVEEGIEDAWQIYNVIDKKLHTGEITSANIFGTRADLENNYLYRMIGAVDGIYGNSKEEAFYPGYVIDSTSKRLDASRSRYTLRFPPGELPPVNAFWSLTMYDLPSRLLVANRLNRYLINSAMLPDLRLDADGGLTIYVQHESPGVELESNWLPAPRGPFMVGLRLYWPKPEVFDGRWKQPPMQRVNG
jgi:hypothetical protein